jgi:transcriptional regulator with XRE-family HTH domain
MGSCTYSQLFSARCVAIRREFLMGNIRPRPKRLAEKLLQIRIALGLSQPRMLRTLGVEEQIDYTMISKNEFDKNEPPLEILLQYARAAGVHMEDLVDDELDLPAKLPANVKHRGLKRKSASRKRR